MRKLAILIIAIISCYNSGIAQGLTVNEEPIITRMMEIYTKGNKSPVVPDNIPAGTVQIIDGFRVQLMATTDRRKVDEALAAFASRYPGIFSGWSQAKPYYRVRVGAFSNRSEATTFLQRIKTDYPDAYIVPDKVRTSEMSGN
jgi:SPOR domain